MFGPLRLLYGLPSRRAKKRPATLPLKVRKTQQSEWTYTEVEVERYPFLVTFPFLGMPRVLDGGELPAGGASTERLWIRGASPSSDFKELCQDLARDLHVHEVMPESRCDTPAFCRMLAKIGYSFAVAELGGQELISPLSSYAVGCQLMDCLKYIGGRDEAEPTTRSLHELDMVIDPSGEFTVVRIRLLARMGTPTYYVVVSSGCYPSVMLYQRQGGSAG